MQTIMSTAPRIPNQFDLSGPALLAIHALGGSARIGEIVSTVISQGNFPEEIVNLLHKGSTSQTELEFRLAWARTNLKKIGYLDNSARSVWTLTAKAKQRIEEKNIPTSEEFLAELMAFFKKSEDNKAPVEPQQQISPNDEPNVSDEPNDAEEWRLQLSNTLSRGVTSDAFERLCKHLLRKMVGFEDVENTQTTRDGGYDGSGRMQLNGLISVNVIFECKLHKTPVGVGTVRSLLGAMDNKADYAMLFTNNLFTKEAKELAKPSSGKHIELIDGERLADLLEEYELGIKTEVVKQVTVDAEWFKNL